MNWIDVFEKLGVVGIVGILLLLLLKYLGEKYITNFFDAQAKTYELELDKNKFRFSKLHEKRMEVIEDIYDKHIRLKLAPHQFIISKNIFDENKTKLREIIKDAKKKYDEFTGYNLSKSIFFDTETQRNFIDINNKSLEIITSAEDICENNSMGKDEYLTLIKKYTSIINELNSGAYVDLEKSLQDEFRELLGVEESIKK